MRKEKKIFIQALAMALAVTAFDWAAGRPSLAQRGSGAASGPSFMGASSNSNSGAASGPGTTAIGGGSGGTSATSAGPTGTTTGTRSPLNDTGTGSTTPGISVGSPDSTGNPTNGSSLNGSGSLGSGSNFSGTGSGFKPASGINAASPVTGTVQSIDSSHNIMQVRSPGGSLLDVDVPSGAMIMNGNDRGSLSDIKTGDSVTVTYGNNGQIMSVERGLNGSSVGMPDSAR